MSEPKHHRITPKDWALPVGYSNGILAANGRTLYMAGQVGWDEQQVFHSAELVPQFEQALKNIIAIVSEAGGRPEDVCRMTCFCTDKATYVKTRKELGAIWKKHFNRHFPAMSMIFVTDLLDSPAMIEIEATAVIPDAL